MDNRENENQAKKDYGGYNCKFLGARGDTVCGVQRQKRITWVWELHGHCRIRVWEHRTCFKERWLRLEALEDG